MAFDEKGTSGGWSRCVGFFDGGKTVTGGRIASGELRHRLWNSQQDQLDESEE
jgi:hypothetical protein